MVLDSKNFEFVAKIIYEASGIVFKEHKKYFVETRLQAHMKELGINDVDRYLLLLRSGNALLDDFISKITTNETYFYREFYHLKALAKHVQEDTFKAPLRILSFPTSSGEEPYSIAIVLSEILGTKKSFSIIGCDIDKNILNLAKEGIYDNRSVSKLPKPYLDKYFKKREDEDGERYHLSDFIKNKVTLKKGSITDREFVRSLGCFHYIFCKNLLIYFDDISKNRAINNLYDVLCDNGWLLLGHAETLSKTTALFEPIKLEDTIIYRKVEDD